VDVGEIPVVSHEDVHSAVHLTTALELRNKYAFGSNQRHKTVKIPEPDTLPYSGVSQLYNKSYCK
jgi:hypothetical protein